MRSDSGTRAGFAPVVLWALASACASPAPPVPASATRAAATTALEVRVPHGRAMTLSTSAQPEFKHLLIEATGEGAPIARAEHLVRWVHQHVRFTPDRHQTLDALLEDRGGNCFDHASLTIALLRSSGFTARFVREVTAAPADEGRAAAARASKSSLFGYEHNDHTWVEVQVDGAWVPADTSLGLFGEREWLAGRVLRGDAN